MPDSSEFAPTYYQLPEFTDSQRQQLAGIFPEYAQQILGETHEPVRVTKDHTAPPENQEGFEEFIHEAAGVLGITSNSVRGIFDQLVVEMQLPRDMLGYQANVVLFDGNEGGITPGRADQILRIHPDTAFFANFTGSDRATEQTKKAFFRVVNPAKPYADDQSTSDEFILNLRLEDDDTKSLKDGFFELLTIELDFEELTGADRATRINEWKILDNHGNPIADDDSKIARQIRYWAGKLHRNHGWWMRDLPVDARVKILEGMKQDTVGFMDQVMVPLRQNGAKVIVYRGNFDDIRTPDTIAIGTPTIPIPWNNAIELKDRGIYYFDNVDCIWSPNRLMPNLLTIVGPFFALRDWSDEAMEQRLIQLDNEVQSARQQGATVAVAVHASPYWYAHNASVGNPQTSVSNMQVGESARKLIVRYKPDFVVHGQLPDGKKDKEGKYLPVNVHLIGMAGRKDAPLLTNDISGYKGKRTVVVHDPFRRHSIFVPREGQRMSTRGRTLPPRVLYEHI